MSTRTRTRHRQPPMQGFLLGLLLCAWLVAQGLGLAHRTLHAGALDASPRAAAAAQAALHVGAAPHAGLFAGHAHAADCQLYDHAGAADLLAGWPALAVPVAWATLRATLLHAGVQHRCEAPFQARAPPSLR